MKLDFPWSDDSKYHQYCYNCHAETVERVYDDDKTFYFCSTCKQRHERSIVIDPAVKWWVGEDGEYWHESAGVFVRNPEGKFLFFERTIFPFAFTVPSGHVDSGEKPYISAVRELKEEAGIAGEPIEIVTENIIGDSCRRGSDAHLWHAYLLVLSELLDVTIKEEGKHPVWLTLDEAMQKPLTFPVSYIISKFYDELSRDRPIPS